LITEDSRAIAIERKANFRAYVTCVTFTTLPLSCQYSPVKCHHYRFPTRTGHSIETTCDKTTLQSLCVLKELPFASTDALEPLNEIVGQDRAREAVRFALAMPHNGYNVYALGRSGLGKRTMMLRYLEQKPEPAEQASDWCYVANYDDPRNPKKCCACRGYG